MSHISVSDDLIGQLIEVDFLDHVSGEDAQGVAHCMVWGKLRAITHEALVIQQWETDGDPHDNAENVVLVRSAIWSVRQLVPAADGDPLTGD